ADEDPTFHVKFNDETGQTLISGMGELHLEVLVDRLTREFNVGANVGKPQVAYRETIKRAIQKVEARYIRQTGGRGQYGHVVIDLEPTGPGGGYEFVNRIVGGKIPREYIPSVDQGIQSAGIRHIRVLVPLAELFGSAKDLRSRTQGRASHTPRQLHAYQEVPTQISKEIVARVRGE